MSNNLPRPQQIAVIRALIEGSSVRSTSRMTDVSIPTVLSLLVRAGEGCASVLDGTMRDLACDEIECDEIWGYVGKKQRHVTDDDNRAVVGDTWVFVAFDRASKLVPCYRVGKRDAETTSAFVADLASRLTERTTLSTDGLALYESAVESAFGCAVDYGQVIKSYEAEATGPGRFRLLQPVPDSRHAPDDSCDGGRRHADGVELGRSARRLAQWGAAVKRAVKEKRGPGRPPFPAGAVRARMFVLRLSEAERADVIAAAKRAGSHSPSDWARDVLLAAARG